MDMPTTGGSLALLGSIPAHDAYQVKKLRQAGAVLLGKVNLHELAMGLTTVSSLGGQTLNPYDLGRAPGGSSGGSAVATAANFAAFTLGTDTSGSVRVPSSHNSIVGLRPSTGLASRSGIIPFGHTQDTGGPMCRTVEDVAIVLDVIVGHDPADPVTAACRGKVPPTYTAFLKRDALKGARIGVLNQLNAVEPEDDEVVQVVSKALEAMAANGAELVKVDLPELESLLPASNLLFQEAKSYLGAYLRNTPGACVDSVEELLASGLHTAEFQQFLEGANAIADGYLASDDYRARLAAREELAGAVSRAMDEERVDCLAYPVIRRIAPEIGGRQLGHNSALAAQAGFPAIAVPAGFTPGGFPVGVELLGRAFAEPTLLGLAFALEQATMHRRPPVTTPSLSRHSEAHAEPLAVAEVGASALRTVVTATGAGSLPASDVPFAATIPLRFDAGTRILDFDGELSGSAGDVAGVFLHRRLNRPNGGVAYRLANGDGPAIRGQIRLHEDEAADLRNGKFYVSVISRKDPRQSARGDIVSWD
jgi:Asp-tRNA(Asn)/Glu-tRNA(Gln) amidotransferase A subunit family amidase